MRDAIATRIICMNIILDTLRSSDPALDTSIVIIAGLITGRARRQVKGT